MRVFFNQYPLLPTMIHAFDTYYQGTTAKTVCLSFCDWQGEKESSVFTETMEVPSDYESGAFYKRELPCILSILDKMQLGADDIIIVDGYVTLNDAGKIGLGGHLYESLDRKYPIIGVAKNHFADPDANRREVFRGDSQRPLYVTAMGMEPDEAANLISSMHGEFRIPTLLKLLDQLSRE